jgi:hypothetical protein
VFAVTIELQTDYPFKEELSFTVRSKRAVRFPLHLRIPGWATDATIHLDGADRTRAEPGTFHTVERLWEGETSLHLSLPMRPQTIERPGGAVSLIRGPLLYALPLGEEWRRVNEDKPHRELPHADWEVWPTTPWNYALDADAASIRFTEHELQSPVFSPDSPPVTASTRGHRVPEWTKLDGSAGPTPTAPSAPTSRRKTCA